MANIPQELLEQQDKTVARFYWGCCMVCRVPATREKPLKRCSRCHSIFYCSVEHQKAHWRSHKRLCLYLSTAASEIEADSFFSQGVDRRSNEEDEEDGDNKNGLTEVEETRTPKRWNQFRMNAVRMCEILTRRQLAFWEKEMFLFPRTCRLCRYAKVEGMIDCPDCKCVSYCSQQHYEEGIGYHKDKNMCTELRIARDCDNAESIMVAQPLLPHKLDKKSKTFELLPDSDMDAHIARMTKIDNSEFELDIRFLSDRLSFPMSLLYAFSKVDEARFAKAKTLNIHVVGASTIEMLGMIKWEYLRHRLPYCHKLTYVFVGPDLASFEAEDDLEDDSVGCCDECRGKITYSYRSCLYEEYRKSPDFSFPDAVIAYNCGFHEELSPENDTWALTLMYLFELPNVPCIFTSYNQTEAEEDMKRIRKSAKSIGSSLKVILGEERNPFGSRRPVRDWECDRNRDVFYHNMYLSIVMRESKD